MNDERSVDEYLGFATRAIEEREQETEVDEAAYEGSWYQLLKQRVDADGNEQQV